MPSIQNYLSQLNSGMPNQADSAIPQQIQNPRPQMVGNGLSSLGQEQNGLQQLYRRYLMDAQAMQQQPVPIEQFAQMMQSQ